MELTIGLLVLLAVGLIIATPVLIIVLFIKQRNLREDLQKLSDLHNRQSDAFHRELLELKRRVAAMTEDISAVRPVEAPQPVESVQQKAEIPVAPPIVAQPQWPMERPSVAAASTGTPGTQTPVEVPMTPVTAKRPEPAPELDLPRLCPWCSTVHSGGVKNCAPKPAPVRPVDAPEIPREQPRPAPIHEPATARTVRPPVARPIEPRLVTPAPTHTSASSTSPSPPPQTHARTTPPPQFSALRSLAAERPAPPPRMKSVFALEETLGTNWLNKLGIILLVIGIASLGIIKLGQLGPFGKVCLSYVVAVALLGGGIFLEKLDRYRVLGHTLIGGGWALFFFTSYALNHVSAMRVMASETTDLILMLAVALAMAIHTLRYRSQLVTGLAFLLAYSTVALSHDNVYSLSAGAVLAIGLVIIVRKMGWFELEVFGILSSYLNHIYWLYRLLGPGGAQGHAFPEYHASTALLLFYWIIYRGSYIVRNIKSASAEKVSTAAALLNTLLLLATMKFQSVQPQLAFYALLIIGAIEFTLGQLPVTKRRRQAFVVLSVLGAALMIAAVPFRYSGNNVAILWLIGAEALLIAGAVFSELVFLRLGLLAGLLVGGHLAILDFMSVMTARHASEVLILTSGVTFALCAIVFYWNALFIAQRWKLFDSSPDSELIAIHSYIGAFSAATAAWALCSGDWTAVAFAAIMLELAWLAQRSGSPQLNRLHVQLQYGFMALLAAYRIAIINLHADVPLHTHVRIRVVTLPIVAAMFYVTAKWSAITDDANQRAFRGVFAFAGTALITALIYYEVPDFWQPLAAIVFAVILLELGQRIRYNVLSWHAHLLSALSALAALTTDPTQHWHAIPLRAFAALPVIAGNYWIAKRIGVPHPEHVDAGRAAYTWIAAGLMTWVLFEAVSAPWIAVVWITFAIALALVMRRIPYRHLAFQANAVAACALLRICTFNYTLQQKLWHSFSLRLVTVSLVTGGLYFLSRKAVVQGGESARGISYLHTFGATGLLAVLAWYEAPSAWIVAVWAIFALALAVLDRRFELDDLRWQAHILAGLTILRSVTFNLQVTDRWHDVSVRLLSLAIVTVVFYALSILIHMPEAWRARDFHHIYSWLASALVAALIWYEVQPLTVAVGWAVFGLVLFEYGLLRKVRQFRFQSYVALTAAFGRIFFANLTVGNPSEFWGPRMYTILPITLILLFVYFQLGPGERESGGDLRLRFDVLMAYLATGTVVALSYFQFANDWIVTAWAVIVFVLFAAALILDRPLFLHQALLLTVGVCTRGLIHNLFGASYFSEGNWTGRYFVLGSAIAILFACLAFAFRLRTRSGSPTTSKTWLNAIVQHPEQFMFFVPVALLTLMLALKMRAGMVTISWGLEGVLIVLFALAVNERSFRLTGLSLLLLCVAKVIAMDAWGLAPRDRYVTFIILGGALLLVSFLYSRYREAIRQFL